MFRGVFVVVCVSYAVFSPVLCLDVVCVSGEGLKYFLETSVVNMSNNKVKRLYLCRFAPLRLTRIKNFVGVYDFSVNIQFSEGTFCVLGGFFG